MNTRARITAVPALLAAGAFASMPGMLKTVAAQHDHGSATPAATTLPAGWADLGLPEVNLTFTLDAIEGMPESIEAGRYLLTVSGEAGPEDFALGAMFLQLPEGLTLDDAIAEASQSEDMPAFLYDSVLAGGKAVLVPAGETSATSIIDLAPGAGQWIVAGAALSRPPVPFTVTGEMPADLPEPESTVTLSMGEMYIEASEGSLIAGENLVKVVNDGVQPHFIEVMGVPDGTTNDNIAATIAVEMGGTPAAEPADLSQAMPVAYFSEQTTGVTSWAPLTLDPGTYAVICWVTDPETGMPHAMLGMHNVFVIS